MQGIWSLTVDLLLVNRLFQQIIVLRVRREKVGRVGDSGEDPGPVVAGLASRSSPRGEIRHVEDRGVGILHLRHDECLGVDVGANDNTVS